MLISYNSYRECKKVYIYLNKRDLAMLGLTKDDLVEEPTVIYDVAENLLSYLPEKIIDVKVEQTSKGGIKITGVCADDTELEDY